MLFVCDRMLVVRFLVVVRTRILTVAPASGSVELSGLLGLLHEDSSQAGTRPSGRTTSKARRQFKENFLGEPSPFLQADTGSPLGGKNTDPCSRPCLSRSVKSLRGLSLRGSRVGKLRCE